MSFNDGSTCRIYQWQILNCHDQHLLLLVCFNDWSTCRSDENLAAAHRQPCLCDGKQPHMYVATFWHILLLSPFKISVSNQYDFNLIWTPIWRIASATVNQPFIMHSAPPSSGNEQQFGPFHHFTISPWESELSLRPWHAFTPFFHWASVSHNLPSLKLVTCMEQQQRACPLEETPVQADSLLYLNVSVKDQLNLIHSR